MISINLVDSEKSQIKYKISQFPDGQQTIDIDPTYVDSFRSFGLNVSIRSRLSNFRDLELIICTVNAIRNINIDIGIRLITPYFLGARSDRKFQSGGLNYLKQVICPIINSLNLKKVTVLDPHSDVLEGCLNNFDKIDNSLLVKVAIRDIGKDKPNVLVSPDAGAFKKIFDVARETEIENIITASKIRNIKTGEIIATHVPNIEDYQNHNFVIIDDICDGGRTFLEIAKKIREVDVTSDIYLVVTHGIFSKGFSELNEYFTKIYTTNSFKEFEENDKLKQLNYF